MNNNPVVCYIGLGSNLDHPIEQLKQAINELSALENSLLFVQSSFYQSAPMGPQDQPDFINAVAGLKTSLSANDLLLQLQGIEQQHGRVREQYWGPRTLDLDLLLYGEQVINTDNLQVPHPGIPERGFVLYPLYEIAPDLEIPTGKSGRESLKELVAKCADKTTKILNDDKVS
ncbi:MAG: 2-amino-4-hydroxy-6-hydroxymethyldihydropteridine diphosphokinase [Gammaproteobacteria bacterium]|nr:2-amino-4-hydroxy-6-hydroxymethyldihydropteridine diphosphokinase [Gammaproteobacteria bacterium]MDH5592915.1 2-amino-4-hydroxy-6-hydroxymethyldihydropteridine diphosphokinase [Gammaproteobacteria bacterium]MDH5614537.1 2-amino-4-hydroxy-6-hydroxymethyldihydropteridine diphosphokinase [Gammaproteobacteria bacterium]